MRNIIIADVRCVDPVLTRRNRDAMFRGVCSRNERKRLSVELLTYGDIPRDDLALVQREFNTL